MLAVRWNPASGPRYFGGQHRIAAFWALHAKRAICLLARAPAACLKASGHSLYHYLSVKTHQLPFSIKIRIILSFCFLTVRVAYRRDGDQRSHLTARRSAMYAHSIVCTAPLTPACEKERSRSRRPYAKPGQTRKCQIGRSNYFCNKGALSCPLSKSRRERYFFCGMCLLQIQVQVGELISTPS